MATRSHELFFVVGIDGPDRATDALRRAGGVAGPYGLSLPAVHVGRGPTSAGFESDGGWFPRAPRSTSCVGAGPEGAFPAPSGIPGRRWGNGRSA